MKLRSRALLLAAALQFVCASAYAQTEFTFTGGGDGVSWSDPQSGTQPNWNPNSVPPAPPNDPTADVTIPSPLHVQVNGVFTVGRITIDSGAQVELPASEGLAIQPGSFTDSGEVVNNGTITIDSGAYFGNGHTTSNVTLSGSGSLVLDNGVIGPNNVGYNGRFINAANTLSGYGEIGSTFAGGGSIAFSNEATVNANVPYTSGTPNPFTINIGSDGSLPFDSYNSGTLEATNGGELQITYGSLDNTGGTITAIGAGSTVVLGNSKVNGGSLVSANGGLLQSANQSDTDFIGVSISGTYQINDNSSSTFTGTINNSGSILINSLPSSSTAILAGDSTLGASFTGGGVIQMANSQNDNRIEGIVANADNTIEGVGLINCTSFTNQSIVDGNVPYNSALNNELTIWNGFTNSGTIEATNGGKIDLGYSGIIYNTGGTFLAADGSLIQIDGNAADIRGGTLSTSGSGLITGANVSLTNLTNNGNFRITSPSSLFTNGTITNNGNISVGTNSINALTSTTLDGTGTVTLAGGQILYYTTGVTFTNNSTIEGNGQIGNTEADIYNTGSIIANVAYDSTANNPLVLEPGSASTNTGTIEASNGGEMEIFRGALTNTGATIEALANSTVLLDDVDLIGGTVSATSAGSQIVINNFYGTTLDGVTLNGTVSQSNSFDSFIAHTITNNGVFTVTNCGLEVTTANATLTGAGSLVLVGGRIDGASVSAAPYPTLTNYLPISGSGDIGYASADVINHAKITATDPSTILYLYPASSFTNASDGTIEASGAAGITVANSAATFTSAGRLQSDAGSNITIDIPATIAGGKLAANGPIFTNNLSITGSVTKTGAAPIVTNGVFSMAAGANFDIGQGPLLIENNGYNYSTVAGYIAAAYDKGQWDMAGLSSSLAKNDPRHATAVALGDNAIIGDATYDGQSISYYTLIATYTWIGDANCDGIVNAADLAMMKPTGTTNATWSMGDFNYDGVVNGDDYALFALGEAESGGANISTTVPEPMTIGIVMAGILLIGRGPRKL